MNLLSWIIFGLTTGLVVDMLDRKKENSSIFSGMLLGMLGAVLGGLLANLFLRVPLAYFNPIPLFVAIAGALFVLSLSRLTKES